MDGKGDTVLNKRAKGRQNEYRSRAILEQAGYYVIRAAGSYGFWDLIGIGTQDIILVQVKTRDWPGSDQIEYLTNFPVPSNCQKLIHRWQNRGRVPEVMKLTE